MIIKAPIKLIGNNGSPYTRKMVSLLRYKHIPYKIIWGEPEEYLDRHNIEKPKPILHPTFLFKNSENKIVAVTDSTPIIRKLESKFKSRSTIPSNPVLRFLNYLLEDYGDEWGTKFMFHYRWYDDKDIDNAGTLLPLYANSTLTNEELSEKKEKIADRQLGRVWVVGSNKKTAPLIDQSFKRVISILEDHFITYPFLLGSRPASADFAFFGQLSQLVGFDPTPRSIIQNISMRTVAWVGKTEDLSGLEPDSEDWISDSVLPWTLKNIFGEIGKTYVPTMLENEDAFNKGKEKWNAVILGSEWEQRTFPYQVKCLQWIRKEFKGLASNEQQKVLNLLEESGCQKLIVQKESF